MYVHPHKIAHDLKVYPERTRAGESGNKEAIRGWGMEGRKNEDRFVHSHTHTVAITRTWK